MNNKFIAAKIMIVLDISKFCFDFLNKKMDLHPSGYHHCKSKIILENAKK